MKHASFPYKPIDSPVYRHGTCEAMAHDRLAIPARFLEIIFDSDESDMVIREAWYTCLECHNLIAETERQHNDTHT